ncbi:hypothetical protein GH714_015569 [Hevea brasiliensis]|uniref:Cytochrome P450 n=1 Tax=Hevea brasiliensis TaxID=3981 RepID=A0A6A6KTP8_HEVBR|nr:hypothetical protein GH714_015569 [Hevea brasiliensis]
MVVSSPSAVEECLTTNDIVFANRPPLTMAKYVAYNCTTIGTVSYGNRWRNLRRISTLEIFSSNRLNVFTGIRRDEIKIFLNKLYSVSSHDFAKVELKPMLMELTFNIIMRMVAGKRYYGEEETGKNKAEAMEFREMIAEVFEYAGASYLGDFLPFLQWIDYQGYLKRAMRLGKRTDRLLQDLIDEHRCDEKASSERRNNTMIDHLLSLQESKPEYYADEIIKGLVLEMLFAGTESSAVTLEWAMSNLLNHPQALEKARNELELNVGEETFMDESDLSKLPYLQNIISETLRLQQVFAIWLGKKVCPGTGLANRVVGFALGSMIHGFEWKRASDEEIDMSEGVGLTMPKAKPLEAMCKARNIMKKVLSSPL